MLVQKLVLQFKQVASILNPTLKLNTKSNTIKHLLNYQPKNCFSKTRG